MNSQFKEVATEKKENIKNRLILIIFGLDQHFFKILVIELILLYIMSESPPQGLVIDYSE